MEPARPPNGPGPSPAEMMAAGLRMPDDVQGKELFADRESALNIFRKLKEVSHREETFEKYRQNFDPGEPGAFVKFEAVMQSIERATLEEMGLASAISDWTKFPGILKMVVYLWASDPIACVLGGGLSSLFADFKDRAEFLCVYIAEAHPTESWNFGQEFNKMRQHKTIEDRIETARTLMKIDEKHFQIFTDDPKDETKVRLVLDTMDNAFALNYDAHPDRVMAVEGDRVAFVGRQIDAQLDEPAVLMTDEARLWLQGRFGKE